MVSFVDITERKRSAVERLSLLGEANAARLEAEAANQAKDQFLAMLGHELRNPLAPILTALQLMRLRSDDTFRGERAVIERQVKHVVTLVDDLLDVSRITRGRIDLELRRIDLIQAVGKAIDERIIRRGPMPDVLGEVLAPKRPSSRLTVINGQPGAPRSRH